jgi:hypothetical protein
MLPMISLVVLFGFATPRVEGIGGLVAVALGLLGLGWQGTERLWYRRVFDGTGISVAELWLATSRYFPRFLALGLIFGLLVIGVAALDLVAGRILPSMLLLHVIGGIVSVLLTFVLPALAFTTRRVRDGLRIGLTILKEDWPRCRWYALFPAIAGFAASRLSVLETAVPGLVWSLLASLVIVAFDGAVVGYYLRRQAAGR